MPDASRYPAIVYVIPAFNEGRVIADVIAALRDGAPPGRVVVIDDASRDDTSARAAAAGAIVLRHPINRGQGAALQTGFDAALRLNAGVAVSFDADGQHQPGDVWKLLDALLEHRVPIALGSRFLAGGADVPAGRRVTLRLGLWFTRFVSRIAVTDTHFGLRALTADALRRIRITEDRMAHASELLDLIAAARIPFVEVPCSVRYTAYSMQKGQRWSAAPRIMFDFLLGKMMR